jgi:hypothetical protein
MRKVQLYINNQRVDLFNDEIISLTQTIKNIRDVSKVFTDFSKSFTVPASKSNNKIFQHFQNFFVIGFDSRTKVPARIEIDDVPFREGKIRLDGVELKSNKPYAYKVTFFGDTVTLKDLLGEEKLSALSDLDAFNQTYDNATVKAALQAATSNHVIAPLITHTQRLFYDSGSTTAQTGNLYNSGTNHGVAWNQLKYAIRLHKIIEAIESRYGLTFSDDFFSTTNLPYYNLFMWLHRNKGEVTSKDGDQQFTKLIDGWSTTQGGASIMTSSTLFLQSTTLTNLTLTLTRSSSTPYNIVITRNDQEVYSQSGIVSGNFVIDLLFTAQPGASYQATISYASAITFSDISWNLVYSGGSDTYATGSFEAPASFEFIITDQIPEIKVIDFLTGLFKMFNLTADLSGSVITVKDLDTYYNEGNIVNITPFIDTESYTVDATTPYREISFKYQDTKAIVAANHNKLTGSAWAQETYNSPDDIKEGETFTVEVPFAHFKYERIVDADDSSLTDIQWGYGVDSNGDSYIGSPLLFYPINQSHEGILFVDEVDSLGDFTASSSITAPINMPSNSLYFDSETGTQNINFKYEKNEYTRDLSFSGTLFNNYYLNYISSIFNLQRRVSKFKAQLPVSFLLNYSLADTLLISDKEYHINSITTNLNTGQSDLELLNIVDAFYEISGNGDGNGEEPGTLTVSVSGQIAPIEETAYTYNATVGGTAEGTPTYSWSVVGGTINGSNTNSSVSITWNAVEANSPGSVTCTVTKGILDPVSDTLNVTVQNSVAAFTVEVTENGSTTLTTPVTEGDTKDYGVQTTGDTTNVSYTWSIVGGTITSGQGTSSVNVTWDTPTTGGYIQVNAFRDGVTFLDSDRYDIVVNAATPAVTFSIAITNVSSPVLEDSVITYGTTLSGTATGGVSYSWNVVGGSFSGQGTSAITVTWNTPGTGSVRVDATREGVGASDQDSISVTALETTATITGDFSNIIEGNSRSYGSTIGGNTSGAISYSWSASGGTITSGQGTASVSVLWSTPGTATLSLTATRESRSGSDSDSLTILPIYYIFNACDGGTTVIDRLTTAPSATNQRYIDFSTSPDATYYTYSGFTQNDSSGYPIVDLQAATPFATGCPEPEPIPLSELSITGATNISGSGQSGVQYTLNVDPNTVSWELSDAALSGFNPIDITLLTSSGTGDSTFTVNFGAYDGNGSETLRSQITATELNPAPGNAAASGSITISQSPPPTATLNVYARANLVTASRTFEYSLGGAYTPIATANITQSCSLIGTVTGITPGATVTLTTSPQNQLLGNNTSTCPGDFTSPSGATTYSITVAAGTNNVALNVDTVSGTFALTVARSLIDGATACIRYASGATGTSYFDGASLQGSTAVFADVNGYEYAAPAWYSDGLDFRYWTGTSFTSDGVCSGGGQV